MRVSKITKAGMLAAMAGIMVFSLGLPAQATTGENGPTPPRLGDPASTPLYEVQVVSVYLTTGTYTLDVNGCSTIGIPYNAPATLGTGNLKANIESCNSGTVSVTRNQTSKGYFYQVTFTNPPILPFPQMIPTPSGPTNVEVSTVQDGNNTGWRVPDGTAAATFGNVTTTQSPHGGYSSSTDYCLQCHSIHGQGNEFALLRYANVTLTCQTCHSLFGRPQDSPGPFDSNQATGENTRTMGSAAARSAYDLGSGGLYPTGGGTVVRGHQIGGTGDAAVSGDYGLTDGVMTLYAYDSYRRNSETTLAGDGFPASDISGAAADGLYCSSCHTPHGDFGQLVNNWQMSDPVVIGTADLVAGDPNVTINFTNPLYDGIGFSSAQRKATLRFETDATGQNDFYTRVFTQFSTSGTDTATGRTGAWATCLKNPPGTIASGGNAQTDPMTICITDLPAASATNVPIYLGDEGRPITSGATPNRVDYDGETGTTADTGWRVCTSVNGAPVLGTGYNTACTAWATATDAESQTVSLYGYKMLSSGPNHQMAPRSVQSYATVSGSTDAWCGTCHTTRWNFDGLHPMHTAGGGCTACHGNPTNQTSFDYPHTSTVSRLLKQLPDGLCVGCHAARNLP